MSAFDAFRDISGLEVVRGSSELALRRTPVFTGLLVVPSKRTHARLATLVSVLNFILPRAGIPQGLMRLYLIPFLKPYGCPRNHEFWKLISLCCAAIKILESVIYKGVLGPVDPSLSPSPYANKRDRSTEMAFSEITDSPRNSQPPPPPNRL